VDDENLFNFKADTGMTLENNICSHLDECLPDEDIGGFLGTYLFEDIGAVKDNSMTMKALLGNIENLEVGDKNLLANWKNWNNEDLGCIRILQNFFFALLE
jgi:hypothetical protein